ncbi:hypothetical protein [Nocardioides lianchengensis]|uniref:Uncharacterized protein n=1 Tax=Nocardioides lianchengensis TaxID=1045774 RepID=A0A1G6LP87_9ACTN|nr:hypothetical protein [Nocardioides lianchengensis]NYG12489.1 hypothetical protein [Nocardioides lianchengensis]SDC45011.1 hypothetical protein SAMN05421872_102316 [Nocardioides lianchengensis]
MTAPRRISVPRPQLTTGPKQMTVDEATVMHLRQAATRVREQRYWGSGVTALVSELLDAAAAAMTPEPSTSPDSRVLDRERCTWAPADGAWWHTCGRSCPTAEQGPLYNTKVGRVLLWDELVTAYGPVEVQS